MIGYRRTSPIDEAQGTAGDAVFLGVNTKVDPAALPEGLVSAAQNKRFDRACAATRAGTMTPTVFNPTFQGGSGPDIHYGAGVWSDPQGREWMLVATRTRILQLADKTTPAREVALPDGELITEEVEFLQTPEGKVLLLRGEEKSVLWWDGDEGGAFKEIDQSSDGTGLSPIPNSLVGAVMSGRVFLKKTRDIVAVSDLLDSTRYQEALSEFRLNSGDDDAIVALVPWRRTNLIVFKEQSIFAINNVTGDLSETTAEVLQRDLGAVSRKAIAQVGGDLFFLAANGVYRLSEVLELALATEPVAVSDRVANLIDRINWTYAHRAAAGTDGRFFRLAVPIDGSKWNNAVLVYDTAAEQWQGLDTWGTGSTPLGAAMVQPSLFGTYDISTLPAPPLAGLYFDLSDSAGYVRVWMNYAGEIPPAAPVPGRLLEVDISGGDVLAALVADIGADPAFSAETSVGGLVVTVAESVNLLGVDAGNWGQPVLTFQFGRGPVGIDRFLNTDYQGKRRAFSVDYQNGRVILLDWGTTDDILGVELEIEDSVLTRGYLFGSGDGKRVQDLMAVLETRRPTVTVEALTDGVNEVVTLVDGLTRSNVRHFVHGLPDWDATNANDDHGDAYREDYTLDLSEDLQLGAAGVDPDLRQVTRLNRRVRRHGRYVQLRVSNTQGSAALEAVQMMATAGENTRRDAS